MSRPRRSPLRKALFTEACEILLEIHEAGGTKAPLKELIEQSKIGKHSWYKYYRLLAEHGFIEVVQETFPGRIFLNLTEKGKKIAELLKQIENEIEEKEGN